ncbi:hypothetical protein G7Y89_g15581 [Cudoniella acicularis]|uniref:Cytochrome P450 n=1 Tax=Cudoniella acicularis TaxID=354080 RepID=A0A8H4VK51_9HELO|nr:hypothetical protein G7Y89_g15581 [Cudoniella acicularis]
MNLYHFAFGAGTRACIGRNISLLEIGKALPTWLRIFDIALADPEKDWRVHNAFVVKQLDATAYFSMREAPKLEKSGGFEKEMVNVEVERV